jgi:hypothetical protein
LQAKLDGIKITNDVALKANKSSKQGTTSKNKSSKQASTSKPNVPKQEHQVEETTSSSSETEHGDESYEKVDDIALFMRRYHKGLKKQGCKVVKRKFPNNKKRTSTIVGAPNTLLPSAHMRSKTANTRKRGRRTRLIRRARKAGRSSHRA